MNKVLLPIACLVVGAGLGFGLDRLVISSEPAPALAPIQPQAAAPQPTPPATTRVDDPKAVYRVTLDDSPAKGPRDAPITIVESLDFECPYCKQVAQTLKQVDEAFPGKVRFVFKHNPLGMHKNAVPAAVLAEEARAQGGDAKFWAAYDRLLAAQSLDRASLEKVAADLKLSPSRVKAALDGSKYGDRTGRDQKQMMLLGATGTPTFFVNGRKLVGAQPLGSFKALIGQELEKAEGMVKAGTPARDLYAKIIEKGATERVMKDAPAPAAPEAGPRKDVVIATRPDDPVRGKRDAPVTVVEFSDFQCPYCAKAVGAVKELELRHPNDVRVIWKHMPLPFHSSALPAAMAAEAARQQGKFWEMHDKLFANQQALSQGAYEQYAKDLGLDLPKFRSAVSAQSTAQRINEDMRVAGSAGVNGTPTFVVNGEVVVGSGALRAAVERQLEKARVAKR
jgi:protein-disulfide isomerase